MPLSKGTYQGYRRVRYCYCYCFRCPRGVAAATTLCCCVQSTALTQCGEPQRLYLVALKHWSGVYYGIDVLDDDPSLAFPSSDQTQHVSCPSTLCSGYSNERRSYANPFFPLWRRRPSVTRLIVRSCPYFCWPLGNFLLLKSTASDFANLSAFAPFGSWDELRNDLLINTFNGNVCATSWNSTNLDF